MPVKIFSFIFFLFGFFLIWQGFIVLQIFGWLLILLVAYYSSCWISPLFVTEGRQLVKIFQIDQLEGIICSSIRFPYWLDLANSLLFIPEEKVFFPEYKKAFVFELETQKTYWKPMSEVNLDEAKPLKSLHTGSTEQQDGLSIYYASPSKEGLRIECSTIGFSLPIIGYYFAFPCGNAHGWELAKRFFTWKKQVVRAASGTVLVKLNKIIFNDNELRYYVVGDNSEGAIAWVMGGKFLIIHENRRVFVLGSFNPTTSIPQTNAPNP
ncbi:hypothetical protein [Chroococcidiopsis thermalis]|uniref:Uncharacterized protein n=1 Tax=Chroococcidiopsis thermalis (strain PCC 7203) TaxID=251229 RepID=K9U086_CHRTP|nr:hypothetical protein [Chroococcidiopsis thermalis]AFY87821.1 hypothetical protein Chro_2330 [Chroococcidiopsis thermalis PCC 7203]PSB41489.1 hypothetical protein C7B80_30505 [Cyanosarcina cf. burmensis CCALA 770]